MRNHWTSLISLLAIGLASCGGSQKIGQYEDPISPTHETVSTPSTNLQAVTPEQPAISPSSTPAILDVQLPGGKISTSAPRKIIEKAKADLVKQFGVDPAQIRIKESRAVTWPDTSLGCPQPDMAYAQVITPGYWVLLEANEQVYPYHTDENEQILLCLGNPSDAGSPLPLIPVNPDEILDGQPWVPVD